MIRQQVWSRLHTQFWRDVSTQPERRMSNSSWSEGAVHSPLHISHSLPAELAHPISTLTDRAIVRRSSNPLLKLSQVPFRTRRDRHHNPADRIRMSRLHHRFRLHRRVGMPCNRFKELQVSSGAVHTLSRIRHTLRNPPTGLAGLVSVEEISAFRRTTGQSAGQLGRFHPVAGSVATLRAGAAVCSAVRAVFIPAARPVPAHIRAGAAILVTGLARLRTRGAIAVPAQRCSPRSLRDSCSRPPYRCMSHLHTAERTGNHWGRFRRFHLRCRRSLRRKARTWDNHRGSFDNSHWNRRFHLHRTSDNFRNRSDSSGSPRCLHRTHRFHSRNHNRFRMFRTFHRSYTARRRSNLHNLRGMFRRIRSHHRSRSRSTHHSPVRRRSSSHWHRMSRCHSTSRSRLRSLRNLHQSCRYRHHSSFRSRPGRSHTTHPLRTGHRHRSERTVRNRRDNQDKFLHPRRCHFRTPPDTPRSPPRMWSRFHSLRTSHCRTPVDKFRNRPGTWSMFRLPCIPNHHTRPDKLHNPRRRFHRSHSPCTRSLHRHRGILRSPPRTIRRFPLPRTGRHHTLEGRSHSPSDRYRIPRSRRTPNLRTQSDTFHSLRHRLSSFPFLHRRYFRKSRARRYRGSLRRSGQSLQWRSPTRA